MELKNKLEQENKFLKKVINLQKQNIDELYYSYSRINKLGFLITLLLMAEYLIFVILLLN